MGFSRKQIEFMKNELGVDEDKLMSVTEDEWDELRLSVFDIEVDELMAIHRQGKDIDRDMTERAVLACSIVDMEYSDVVA